MRSRFILRWIVAVSIGEAAGFAVAAAVAILTTVLLVVGATALLAAIPLRSGSRSSGRGRSDGFR
ncbi:MAG TPA: hypothetical protein VFN24_10925 [Microbacterium sp.]|nr:hypothetical protein [Microbacterium sp.]